MLAEVCLSANRPQLARTILEELNQQIIDNQLDRCETSGLVGGIWSRLYKIYRKSESSSEQDEARVLYKRLCQLDPWQAFLSCED